VTNEITNSEFVVSSSLHGLIIADAFGIPNARLRISDRMPGGDWKFMDYFSSVGRSNSLSADTLKAISEDRIFDVLSVAERSIVNDISNRLLGEFARLDI
jgi:hypothetical protein